MNWHGNVIVIVQVSFVHKSSNSVLYYKKIGMFFFTEYVADLIVEQAAYLISAIILL